MTRDQPAHRPHPCAARPRGRPHLHRRGLRRRRRDLRRGGLQHRHDRLPGDPHRPVLPPPGRRDDRPARRQHRRQRRGPRVRRASGSPGTSCATPPGCRAAGARSARLDDELVAQGVVGISGIDTRALTRHLRERGAMRVGISSTETDPPRCWRGCGLRRDGRRRAEQRGLDRPRPTSCRRSRRVGREALHRRRPRPRHQDDDAAPDGRARHRGARAAGHRDARRRARRRRGPRRAVLLQRPRRPGRHDPPGRRCSRPP